MTQTLVFRRIVLVLWILSIVTTIVVSLTPRLTLPLDFWNADKLYHGATYAWLGALPLWAFASGDRGRTAGYSMVLLGALLEVAQMYVPGRSASLGDAVANALGVFAGMWLSERFMACCRGRRGLGG